jgi:hypothetical protein
MILGILSRCLDHYATSVIKLVSIVTVFVYRLTWRLVSYIRRRTRRAPHPSHDVAGQSFDMDRFKAEARREAGLGFSDVAAHS